AAGVPAQRRGRLFPDIAAPPAICRGGGGCGGPGGPARAKRRDARGVLRGGPPPPPRPSPTPQTQKSPEAPPGRGPPSPRPAGPRELYREVLSNLINAHHALRNQKIVERLPENGSPLRPAGRSGGPFALGIAKRA